MDYKYNNFDTLRYDAEDADSPSAENAGGVAEQMQQSAGSAMNTASSARNALRGSGQGGGKSEAGKALGKGGGKGNGKAEVNKMKNDKASRKRSGGGKGSAGGGKAKGGAGGASGGDASKGGGGSASGVSAGDGSANGGAKDAKTQDNGGKYDMKKAFLNKFKFKLQKNSAEEEKAEAEANRCDPCNELKAGNGLDFGCIDWGKCAFIKPCCKKAPYPCGCFAYMCFGITFIGGLISSILLF